MEQNESVDQNTKCNYYPCHKELESCKTCYCPFYPCGDETVGGYYLRNKRFGEKVWACENCTWIHTKSVVVAVDTFKKENPDLVKKFLLSPDVLYFIFRDWMVRETR